MANRTVYPFGTDGALPSDIGIINDLNTGGVDKALSAEMGKEIGSILGVESGTVTDVTVSSFVASTLTTTAVTIVRGRTYTIAWAGASTRPWSFTA